MAKDAMESVYKPNLLFSISDNSLGWMSWSRAELKGGNPGHKDINQILPGAGNGCRMRGQCDILHPSIRGIQMSALLDNAQC